MTIRQIGTKNRVPSRGRAYPRSSHGLSALIGTTLGQIRMPPPTPWLKIKVQLGGEGGGEIVAWRGRCLPSPILDLADLAVQARLCSIQQLHKDELRLCGGYGEWGFVCVYVCVCGE